MKHAAAIVIFAVVMSLALPSPVSACLWDTDTLLDERRGMPSVAAILAGKWERHSAFFYQQRLAASAKALQADPKNLAAMDDLAVALEKTGRVDEAIDVMTRKLALDPNGYTTHANLGTFYLHRGGAGDFDRGVEHIERALEINPNAHFGREKYQLQLARYLAAARKDPAVRKRGSFVMPIVLGRQPDEKLDEKLDEESAKLAVEHFSAMRGSRGKQTPEIEAAIEGVVGMIRFGTGTSPDLFFALGDLLAARGDKHLAYRAYRRALELNHPEPEQVRGAMEDVRRMHEDQRDFADDVIDTERKAGEAWVAAYQAYEDDLLRAGRDTADIAQFAAFYKKHGDPRDKPSQAALWRASAFSAVRRQPLIAVLVAAGVALALAAIRQIRSDRRRQRRAAAPAASA